MNKQAQVEGFERDMRALIAESEAEQDKLFERHDGDMNDRVMAALKIIHAEKRLAIFLLQIEWGIA